MNTVAQLIVIRYNGQFNAYGGKRNDFTKVDVVDRDKIKETILEAFQKELGEHRGSVLVKFDGKMWLCERDTVNKAKVYARHEITYHPLSKHFTI